MNNDPLIQRVLNKDYGAFDELMRIHEKNVYNLAYRIVNDKEDAADITQEVFIRIYNNLSKFNGQSSLSTWIYRITNNYCIDYLRKNKKHQLTSLDETNQDGTPKHVPSLDVDMLQSYEDKIAVQNIYTAMQKLSPKYKSVLALRESHELSYEEIAEVLHCSIGTVKSRIKRARDALHKLIVEQSAGGARLISKRGGRV